MRKIIVLCLSIVLVLIILGSSTYSLLFKEYETLEQSYTTGILEITSETTNNSVTLNNALPMEDTAGAVLTPYTFKITNTGNLTYQFDVKLLSTTTSNQINSQFIKVMVNDNSPVALNGLADGVILGGVTLNPGASVEITLRVWLDINTSNTEIGKVFNGKVTTEGQAVYTDPNSDTSGANAPALVDGLIPVTYDEESNTWLVADSSNSGGDWYNYSNKKWANAVLVTNDKRSSLTKDSSGNYTPGQTIGDTEADGTLAFYVWIPRYKYKVWNIEKVAGTDSYDAYNTGIDIVFENGTSSTGTITCNYDFTVTGGSGLSETCTGSNGDYYTHPAFNFGNDKLTGIWVGKFEVSSETPTASYGGGDSDTLTPRILPNVVSWRYNYVDKFWKVIYNMQTSSNIYGLSTSRTNTDSHLLTNMEWGAVAYLTHSKYGRCTDGTCEEVAINNSSSCYTGRSGGAPGGSVSTASAGTYTYNENKTETTLKEGTGTSVTVTATTDETYSWTETNGVWSSGNAGTNSSTSTLTYTFTLASTGALSFDYSYSSEANYDKLKYTITNSAGTAVVTSSEYSGTALGTAEASLIYNNAVHVLEAETYTLTITYTKDSSSASGLDKAYIKNVTALEGVETMSVTLAAGQLASTTGNIYGVYDMNGGSWEYVYGNMSSTAGSYTYYPSSAAGTTYYTYEGYENYITTYSYGTAQYTQTAYNRARLGEGTSEVVTATGGSGGWYGDYAVFPNSSSSWFVRGGAYDYGTSAGVFDFRSYNGAGSGAYSSRAALVGVAP